MVAGLMFSGASLAAPQQSKKPQAPVVSEEPPFNPLAAEKNVEVGVYYMKKGNYDAAIERFKMALGNKPNFARPHRLIGEALEKKGEKAEAVESYKRYLEIVPNADDAGKIRQRIAKLTQELERRKAKKPST